MSGTGPPDPPRRDGEARGRQGPDVDAGRRLFRYVTAEEWQDYRRIMAVFAGTFFSEFSPDEVDQRLGEQGLGEQRLGEPGADLEAATVAERLESLRRWGNLTVSSSTGTPRSLADYYRRRNRYLITRAGQEVHEMVEGILARVDEVRDVSTGRLRSLLEALEALQGLDPAIAAPQRLADLIGAVFDPHQAFTSEITQFFAAINQWQSRYDLSPEELGFFAQVLVGYVTERLEEIERISRPIAVALRNLRPKVPAIVERANRGLAARVEEAGMADAVTVSAQAGTRLEDWAHLQAWFVGEAGRPARMDRLRTDAVAAVRTLTLNLIRLSRVGAGSSSRRSDLLRLAGAVAGAAAGSPDDAYRLLNAAFGLYPANHLSAVAADAADPVASTTSWWDAPIALVPVSLRERGDTAARGQASPLPDRSAARRELERRRQQEVHAAQRVDVELLSAGPLDGSTVSVQGLSRLEQLVGRALTRLPKGAAAAEVTEGIIVCRVERRTGPGTRVSCPEGTLTLMDLEVLVSRQAGPPATHAPLTAAGSPAST